MAQGTTPEVLAYQLLAEAVPQLVSEWTDPSTASKKFKHSVEIVITLTVSARVTFVPGHGVMLAGFVCSLRIVAAII